MKSSDWALFVLASTFGIAACQASIGSDSSERSVQTDHLDPIPESTLGASALSCLQNPTGGTIDPLNNGAHDSYCGGQAIDIDCEIGDVVINPFPAPVIVSKIVVHENPVSGCGPSFASENNEIHIETTIAGVKRIAYILHIDGTSLNEGDTVPAFGDIARCGNVGWSCPGTDNDGSHAHLCIRNKIEGQDQYYYPKDLISDSCDELTGEPESCQANQCESGVCIGGSCSTDPNADCVNVWDPDDADNLDTRVCFTEDTDGDGIEDSGTLCEAGVEGLQICQAPGNWGPCFVGVECCLPDQPPVDCSDTSPGCADGEVALRKCTNRRMQPCQCYPCADGEKRRCTVFCNNGSFIDGVETCEDSSWGHDCVTTEECSQLSCGNNGDTQICHAPCVNGDVEFGTRRCWGGRYGACLLNPYCEEDLCSSVNDDDRPTGIYCENSTDYISGYAECAGGSIYSGFSMPDDFCNP